jgi:hypothetical protein
MAGQEPEVETYNVMGAVWFTLLWLILLVWYPLNFAVELLTVLPSIGMRGLPAVVELLAHGLVAATCVAAGLSLWSGTAHGPALARIALVAVALIAVQSSYWSALPSQTMPGDRLPLAALAVVHAGLWLIYLHRSARIKSIAAES